MYEALYIHLPFCKQRCTYCNFTTEALPQDDAKMDEYLEMLIKDIRAHARSGELARIKTIYLGGGTPTHFGHKRLVELCYTLSLSIRLEHVEEFTLEANPESLTPEIVRDLYALGVTRISLGVQSFIDEELEALGRIHSAARAKEAYAMARERFDNISIDLMCGIPTQTEESWSTSLESAIALDPEHISVYPLQLEEDTLLYKTLGSQGLSEADEDKQADLLLKAAELLNQAGYDRYEVASYAKPGKEAKHNSMYWTGNSYLGLGMGAASMRNNEDGTRERWVVGDKNIEHLNQKEALAEDLMLGLRMSKGVSFELINKAKVYLPEVTRIFKELEALGLIEKSQEGYIPTAKGWLMGNELYGRIWSLAE